MFNFYHTLKRGSMGPFQGLDTIMQEFPFQYSISISIPFPFSTFPCALLHERSLQTNLSLRNQFLVMEYFQQQAN